MKRLFRIGIIITALLCLAACGTKPVGPAAEITSSEEASQISATTTQPSFPAIEMPTETQAGQSGTSKSPITSENQPSNLPTTLAPTLPEIVTVVIPEGFTFYQIARRLEANGVCAAADFYRAAQGYEIQSFPAPVNPLSCYRLEGLLYPDTYDFYQGEDPGAVLRKMLNNYAEKSGLPDYDTLILASIIERETRSSGHMAMVSSVFHNRLKQGMRLQADATIAYVEDHIKQDPLVQNPGQYAERYNTYKCPALPVGPICSPSRRAIDAAKNPSTSDYLYYFFGKDETNHYTKTYDEHLAAIKMYGLG